MNYFKQFVIQFSGLKIGEHQFNFDVNKKFFDEKEFSEINEGKVSVDVFLVKEENMLIFNFAINGFVVVNCDRCSYPFDLEISGEKRLIVKFGEKEYEETEEILIIPESEYQIDLSHYVYEYINLLLPAKKIHPKDEKGNSKCNSEVINKLNNLESQNTIDPRWNELKKLKNKK